MIFKTFVASILATSMGSVIAAPGSCSFDLKPGVTEVLVRSNEVADLCLPQGEKIASQALGDSNSWHVQGDAENGRLMVRVYGGPASTVISTNLIVWSSSNQRYEVKLIPAR